MLRVQKVRDGEDAIGPSRTGLKTRNACATQIFRSEDLYHSGFVILIIRVHSWLAETPKIKKKC
jgi:hypothetical protein